MVIVAIHEEQKAFIAHTATFPYMKLKTLDDDLYLWKISLLHPTPLAVASHGNYCGAFYGVQIEFSLMFPRDYGRQPFPAVFDSQWIQRVTKELDGASWNTACMKAFALRAMQYDEAEGRSELERSCIQDLEKRAMVFLRYQTLLASPGTRYPLKVTPLVGLPMVLMVTRDYTVADVKHHVLCKEGISVDRQRILFGGTQLDDQLKLRDCSALLQMGFVQLIVKSAEDWDGWLGMPHTISMHERVGIHRAFERAAISLWVNDEIIVDCNCQQCSARADIQDLFKGKPPSVAHWILRCNSPSSNIVWSPETDKMWPFLFRLNIRYLTKIKVAQGSGELIALPLDVVRMIAVHL